MIPLREHLPDLDFPHVVLGEYPTPVQPLRDEIWLKREDRSSSIYGGNKLRSLEPLLADAARLGIKRVWTLGAWGSNQALALALHAPRAGLEAGAVLFPQRATPTAAENLRASICHTPHLKVLRSLLTFPGHWLSLQRGRDYLVPPGGAVPLGALGHVNAALELAMQIQRGEMPAPARIVLAVGSTCTTAGLLVGLPLAKQLGLWPGELPQIVAVRVTPWPITSRVMILRLARATARELAARGGPVVRVQPQLLRLETRQFGWGYARITRPGLAAVSHFAPLTDAPLDSTYAAKSAAALLALDGSGPTLFWCTKSSAPLPALDQAKLATVPSYMRRWLKRADSMSGRNASA